MSALALRSILLDPRAADLADLGARWGMGPDSARRAFRDCVGISPKRFAQLACAQTGAEALADGASALDASLEAGGSSAGFLHAVSCSAEALTPGELAGRGAGLRFRAGFLPTLLGPAFAARSDRGLAHLHLMDSDSEGERAAALASLAARFPSALVDLDDGAFEDLRRALLPGRAPARLHLMLSGTNFQIKAWQAAMGIPCGSTRSYGSLAEAAGSPGASRAAGSAMAANPIALLVPCHRALPASGEPGAYRWSSWRKRAILALEAAGRG